MNFAYSIHREFKLKLMIRYRIIWDIIKVGVLILSKYFMNFLDQANIYKSTQKIENWPRKCSAIVWELIYFKNHHFSYHLFQNLQLKNSCLMK